MTPPFHSIVAGLALALASGCGAGEDGQPRIGGATFLPEEIGRPVAWIESPGGHGSVGVVNGLLMVIDSSDAGGSPEDGGIEFWDLSDPRRPVRVARHDDARTHRLREPHGFGLARIGPKTFLAAQSLEGLQVWDVTSAPDVELCADLDLPGIDGGDYAGNWWVAWQGTYIYVAGRNAGLYIVDAAAPEAPVLANHLPTGELGGVGPAIVQPFGNLLVLTSNPAGGILTMDASDPIHPAPIEVEFGPRGYSHLFAEGLLIEAGGQGDPEQVHVRRIGHDGSITPLPSIGDQLGDGGYGEIQDGVFHAGFSDHMLRFDLAEMAVLGGGSGGLDGADEDFAVPLGNVTFVGNDHEGRSALVPHAIEPDRNGPRVTWVHPADGADGQAVTTRIGLSMSDQIDVRSLEPQRISLRRVGGSPVACRFSLHGSTVHIAPLSRLLPGAEYRIEVDGVRDVAGNPGDRFSSTFRTALASSAGQGPPAISVESLGPALVDDAVLFDVDAVGGAPATGYVWDFGDGTPPTTSSPYPAASHVYASPGRYTVLVTAANEHGQTGAAAVQIVHRPLEAEPPQAASSVAESAALLHIANHDNDTVTAILGSTSAKVWEVNVPPGPTSIAVDPADRVWVTCRDADAVAVLDSATGATLTTISLDHGAAPTGVVFAPGEDAALVILEGDRRVVRLALDGSVEESHAFSGVPGGLAVAGGGDRVVVARLRSGAAPAQIVELGGAGLTAARTIGFADDPGPDTEASGRGRPNDLASVVITPDGAAALVASKKDNLARGVWRDGEALDFESTVRAIVSRVDLAAGEEVLDARIDLNDRALARSLLTSPRGDLTFVAAMGNGVVDVYDTWRGDFIAELPVGRGPRGLAINRLATKLYVHETLDRSVAVFDIRELLAGRAGTAPLLVRTSLVASESLPPAVLRGKRVFHDATDLRMARDGYHTCAGCHPDGGHDGAVWDFTQFGEGLRNTITLTGRAGPGHGLLHWTANFDEVQDFEGPIRELGGGLGFLDVGEWAATAAPLGPSKAGLAPELDDLAAYVASLDSFPRSPHRGPAGERSAAGIRGEAAFVAAGCAACHVGPDFTDRLRHDIGTAEPSSGLGAGAPLAGVGFETPTLRGVWATAPYLHDGRAATLEEALGLAGHGAALGAADRADIAAFLRELE